VIVVASGSNTGSAFQQAGLLYPAFFTLSTVFPAASTILKVGPQLLLMHMYVLLLLFLVDFRYYYICVIYADTISRATVVADTSSEELLVLLGLLDVATVFLATSTI
jgi:hypothetical protein